MSDRQVVRNPENDERKQPDELSLEALDPVVGAGGKKPTPPPDKPVKYLEVTLTECNIS